LTPPPARACAKRQGRCDRKELAALAIQSDNAEIVANSVLVVDDDHSIRLMVRSVLSRSGLEVDLVASGNEAITRLRERRYAAVILDVMMRDGSGHDVLAALATLQPDVQCVIVITAGSPANLEKIDDANVRFKLRKPFNIDELVGAVRQCVDASIAD
jgi:CheY-like chemotaxis protein